MNREIIYTNKAPEPIGPYSQAVKSGGMLFASGQIAIDVNTGDLNDGSVEDETRTIMKNLHEVLRASEMDFINVVRCTIYLTDMADFPRVNKVYGDYFRQDPPARETVQVAGLPKGARVEISLIAI